MLLQFSSVQSLSQVRLFVTPWTAACPMDCSIPGFPVHHQLVSIESVMPSNHLILCCLLLPPPSIFSSIRVFSNESALHIRWPKYCSFSFSLGPSNEYSGLISFRTDWFAIQPNEKAKSAAYVPGFCLFQFRSILWVFFFFFNF